MVTALLLVIALGVSYFVWRDWSARRRAAKEAEKTAFATDMHQLLEDKRVRFQTAYNQVFESNEVFEKKVRESTASRSIPESQARNELLFDLLLAYVKHNGTSGKGLNEVCQTVQALAPHMDVARAFLPTVIKAADKAVVDDLTKKGQHEKIEEYWKLRKTHDSAELITLSLRARQCRDYGLVAPAELLEAEMALLLNADEKGADAATLEKSA